MKLYFFRHGKTVGNLKKAYVGRSDPPLCPQGREELNIFLPHVADVFVSPKKRCVETVDIIAENAVKNIVIGLEEMDFGTFEGKNYEELKDNLEYRRWVSEGCLTPCPEGEGVEIFTQRVKNAFLSVVLEEKKDSLVFVVHGGTIMALTSCFLPNTSYFQVQIPCGTGISVDWDGKIMSNLQKITKAGDVL